MNRRHFVSTAAAPLAASLAQAQPARKPNIIFILADDLGYGDLGCYGSKEIHTPAVDQLAAEGLRFTQAYAGSTVCAPSRCTLMTGFHTGHCRVRGNIEPQIPLRESDVTVAELLKRAGYRTGMFGKWGLGEPYSTGIPSRKGFDEFFGYLDQTHAHNYWTDTLWENQTQVWLQGNFGGQNKQYSHDVIAQRGLEFLEKSGDQPFFLYLPYTIPHSRWDPPSLEPYAKEDWPDQKKKIAAMITRMDTDIGKLMATLKRKGLDENTLVIFASDNGPVPVSAKLLKSGGPLRGVKRDMYDGGIRVPFIARWTGRIKPGAASDHVIAFWDLLPTACELAGVPSPAGIDGISYLPTLLGKPQKQHEHLYWEFYERGFTQAARMGDWKAVRNGPGKPLEIFNLRGDPGEQHELAASHPEIVARMEQIIKTAHTPSDIWPVKRPPA